MADDAPANRDFSPILYYYHLRHWMSRFRVRFGLLEAGLVVVEVDPGSRAHQAGLRGGAVIMKYNGKPVRTLAEFQAADDGAGGRIRLRLLTGKTVRFSR